MGLLLARKNPIPIRMDAGLMDFSISNGVGVRWVFPDGTVSFANRPAKMLAEPGIVYLYCDNLSQNNIVIKDNDTSSVYLGDLGDFRKSLTYSLDLAACSNITGDLSSVSRVNYYLDLYNCSRITGDLSDVSGVSYYLNLYNCSNITGDLSSVSGVTYYLNLTNCSNITGTLTPTSSLQTIYLNNTGLSSAEVDQSAINLDNVTEVSGTLYLSGLTRTAASTAAINSLVTKGWSVTDATVI